MLYRFQQGEFPLARKVATRVIDQCLEVAEDASPVSESGEPVSDGDVEPQDGGDLPAVLSQLRVQRRHRARIPLRGPVAFAERDEESLVGAVLDDSGHLIPEIHERVSAREAVLRVDRNSESGEAMVERQGLEPDPFGLGGCGAGDLPRPELLNGDPEVAMP